MSRFTVSVKLAGPRPCGRGTRLDIRVDTHPAYVLMPKTVTERLGIPTVEERGDARPTSEQLVYRLVEVRLTLENREFSTIVVAGAPEASPHAEVFSLEPLEHAADLTTWPLARIR
jgi:predicted aspartyl protease